MLHTPKSDTVISCQGADVLNEIFKINDKLKLMKNISLYAAVWLNKISKSEILNINNKKVMIFQSSTNFGSYDSFLSQQILLNGCRIKKFKTFAVNKLPAGGQNEEVLNYHNLSAPKILKEIQKF